MTVRADGLSNAQAAEPSRDGLVDKDRPGAHLHIHSNSSRLNMAEQWIGEHHQLLQRGAHKNVQAL